MLNLRKKKISLADTPVWHLTIKGPAVTKWDITIRKERLLLSVNPDNWRAGQPVPEFVAIGPDGRKFRRKAQSLKGSVLLTIPCRDVLAACREIALDLQLGELKLQETIPLRCVTAEDFTRYLQFTDDRRMSDGRKFNREIIAGLALRSSQTQELEPHFRVASAVVHIYKALELPKRIPLPPASYVAEFEKLANGLLEQRGNIRTDGVQIYLSILTAGWHRSLAEGDIKAVLRTLTRIRDISRRLTAEDGDLRDQHRISYAKNIGIALLMLAYIQRLGGRPISARNAVGILYNFQTATSGLLTDLGAGRGRVSVDPSWFKDTLECGHCTYLGLCIDADTRGKSRSAISRNLDIAVILEAALRVRIPAFVELAIRNLTEYEAREKAAKQLPQARSA